MDAGFWANIIATAAFVVSVSAALFSWKSAHQAKIANRIGIHVFKKEIYLEFQNSRHHLLTRGPNSEQSRFLSLGPHVKTAQAYLSAGVSNKLSEFYDECFRISDLKSEVDGAREHTHFIATQPLDIAPQERATEIQRLEANKELEEARFNLNACVKKANGLAVELDELFLKEMKIL